MFDRTLRKIIQKKLDEMLAPRSPMTADESMKTSPPLRIPATGRNRARKLLEAMELDEKLSFVSGIDEFCIPGVPRLGLPPVWTSDTTSGIRGLSVPVTDLPANIAMAATWNPSLIADAAAMVGSECRATGIGVLLAPGVNIARIPVCGRNFEYLGEDPFLAGEIAAAYVRGVQSEGVIATVKHFACNNSEYDRHKTDSVVDERTLREIYLPAFRRAVEAGSLGVMTSYNQINGQYGSENEYLIEDILRGEWGFDGMVVSDWDSLYSTEGPAKHGVDLEMPRGRWMGSERLKAALEAGTVTVADIDRKVLHILTAYDRAGLFDRPPVDAGASLATRDHRLIADAVADEAIVLLKNESSMLPLSPRSMRRIVVIGRNSKVPPTGGGGSSYIKPTAPVPSLAQALRDLLPDCDVSVLEDGWMRSRRGRHAVAAADAVCFETGYDRAYESEAYDRIWKLPEGEARKIRTAGKLNRNVVVILHGGGDMETSSWIDAPKAVLHAFYLGTSSSQAIAKVLTGEVNPSGRLPFTMALDYDDYRSAAYYPKRWDRISVRRIHTGQGDPGKRSVWPIRYGEALLVGYRNFDSERLDVRFPFGHGLSYTTFEYASPVLEDPKGDELVRLSCTISNVGAAAGAETAQLYVHEAEPAVFRPEQELKAFRKIFLAPGETERIEFSLRKDAFSRFDADAMRWKMKPGIFELRVGSSSRDIRLTIPVELSE